ncbi:MAG: hypothetical protein GY732_13610 [Gammaproteobacteria bacterium]|nr:hypothetical protein [Gammaproteobacteria bacterium]
MGNRRTKSKQQRKANVTAVPYRSWGGGELGWVPAARTRHEHVRVGSVATSLSLTVLAAGTHPNSGHTDGNVMELSVSTIAADGV